MNDEIIKMLLEQNARLIEQNNALAQQSARIADQLADVLRAFAERENNVNVVVNSYNGSHAESKQDNSHDESMKLTDVEIGDNNGINSHK